MIRTIPDELGSLIFAPCHHGKSGDGDDSDKSHEIRPDVHMVCLVADPDRDQAVDQREN